MTGQNQQNNQTPQDPKVQSQVDPVVGDGQDPSQANQNQVQPQQVSYDSPESGPASVAAAESAPASVEYGYESIKKIEQSQEPEQGSAEKKEFSPPIKPSPPQTQQKKQQQAPPPQPAPAGPKFFGYKVPPQFANNFQMIRKKKGKGNPNDARTWVYVLLDRILKKKTYDQ